MEWNFICHVLLFLSDGVDLALGLLSGKARAGGSWPEPKSMNRVACSGIDS